MANRKEFLDSPVVTALLEELHAAASEAEVMCVFVFADERGKSVWSTTDNKLAIAGVCAETASQEIGLIARESRN